MLPNIKDATDRLRFQNPRRRPSTKYQRTQGKLFDILIVNCLRGVAIASFKVGIFLFFVGFLIVDLHAANALITSGQLP